MPLYEYVCETDGSVFELMRPMADADKPVADPEGRGRVFVRKHSTFATGGAASAGAGKGGALPMAGGCCPCGKNASACGRG